MPSPNPPVRVVQCPKCGSPIEGASPGEIVTCSYCGATLEVAAGASGHPIAKLASIETSTVYLARTEALKRLKTQLAAKDEALEELRAVYRVKVREAEQAHTWRPGCWFTSVIAVIMTAVVTEGDPYATIGAGMVLLALLVLMMMTDRRRAEALDGEAHAILQQGLAARAERDRLAQRIAELEAGLDDLAEKL
jgi:uncharacterized Zn finger protein (UPF0148 family)